MTTTSDKRTFVYKKTDQIDLRIDVYGADEETKPGVFYIHGGGFLLGSRTMIGQEYLKSLLDTGFVVTSIDYRLAPETKVPVQVEDLCDAWKWVISEGPRLFNIDPDRLAVSGSSAGGHYSLVAGYRFDPRPKAIAALCACTDIDGPWCTLPYDCGVGPVSKEEALATVGTDEIACPPDDSDRVLFYYHTRQNGTWMNEMVGHDPKTAHDIYDPLCPIRNVDENFPPTILIHGGADEAVPVKQAKDMAKELAKAGVEHELFIIPSAPHAFETEDWVMNPDVIESRRRTVEFLKKRIG